MFISHRAPGYLAELRAKGLEWDEMKIFEELEYRDGAPFCGTSPIPLEANRDTFVTRNALTMLDELAKGDKPFVLWCSFYGPHAPLSVPIPFDRMYAPDTVQLPPNFDDTCFDKPPHVLRRRQTDRASVNLTEDEWRRVIAHYWGYVSFLDSLFGRLLNRLQELGLWDDTAIVFLSDHGEMLGDHRLMGKGFFFYDGIMRVPFIVRVPGMSGGKVERGLVSLVDFAPTVLDIMGITPTITMDGKSLLPAIHSCITGDKDAVFGEHHGRPDVDGRVVCGRMLRTANFKYCLYSNGQEELYDLKADPSEIHNLVSVPEYSAVRTEIKLRLEEWMFRTGDFYPNAPEELVSKNGSG